MLIGLTGSAGCGKSAALEIFKALGWCALDADAICHRLYSDPSGAIPKLISKRWGREALDSEGRVLRPHVSAIVFRDEAELIWLNSVLHPEIQRAAFEDFAKSGAKYGVFEAALLFEASWRKLFHSVICVWCETSLQFGRLRARGWSEETIKNRLSKQMSSDKKLELADFGIINNSSFGVLEEQCATVADLIRNSNIN